MFSLFFYTFPRALAALAALAAVLHGSLNISRVLRASRGLHRRHKPERPLLCAQRGRGRGRVHESRHARANPFFLLSHTS